MERCRIWWPRQQRRHESEYVSGRHVLLGWLFARAGSVDIVVAAAVPQGEILRSFPTIGSFQTAIISSNKRMPVRLQKSAAFTILGDCGLHLPREFKVCCGKQKYQPVRPQVQKKHFDTNQDSSVLLNGSLESGEGQDQREKKRKWKCNCDVLDGFLDTCKKSVVKDWVHFCCKPAKSMRNSPSQIPVLDHLYLDGQKFEINHCHVCHTIRCSNRWYKPFFPG